MTNPSETTTVLIILLIAIGILGWGFIRARTYGKLGILAWFQSFILIAPWLIFFGLFSLGIYLSLVGILFLLIASVGIYIYLGRRLRAEGQDIILKERAAQRLKQQAEAAGESRSSDLSDAQGAKTDLKIMPEVSPISEDDLQKIKTIFGIDTFFATETIPYQEGAIFKGNLRGDPDSVYPKLAEKLKAGFGEQYRLFLVEGTEGKPVVIVLPSSDDPVPATLAQKNLALLLAIATFVTTLESAGFLLGFDLFNNWGRYQEVLPLSLGLWAVLIAHEVGHRLLARRYQVKVSVPFFLPTWQIGSFGAITRFESLLPNRNALMDIALAGPAFGGITSLLILIVGLLLSHPGSLFQIPTPFFQGSILVGSLAKVVLGSAIENAIVDVNPLLMVGWLGLVITALNLLPAGQLDGGRLVQAIYGRKTARRATVATLIVLGVVSLINPGNSIPLYWAVLIIFLQRELERPSLNELSEPDDARAAWGLLALFLMLATLIPLSPGLAGRLGIGG